MVSRIFSTLTAKSTKYGFLRNYYMYNIEAGQTIIYRVCIHVYHMEGLKYLGKFLQVPTYL